MKILISAVLLMSFLSACEQMAMNDGMAMEGEMAMEGAMDDGMDSMAGG